MLDEVDCTRPDGVSALFWTRWTVQDLMECQHCVGRGGLYKT